MIREFGILNTHMPENHERYGVPYPGTYMVDRNGLVFEKSFFAEHGTRESVNGMLQESFRVDDLERGEVQVVTTPHLTATAYFASPTVRPRQRTVLTVDISLAAGIHVNGRTLPEGYVPVELVLDGGAGVVADRVDYPEPEELHLEVLGERMPVYTERLEIKAHCEAVIRSREEQQLHVSAQLQYQACDDRQCYLPQTLTFRLPLRFLPHVR